MLLLVTFTRNATCMGFAACYSSPCGTSISRKVILVKLKCCHSINIHKSTQLKKCYTITVLQQNACYTHSSIKRRDSSVLRRVAQQAPQQGWTVGEAPWRRRPCACGCRPAAPPAASGPPLPWPVRVGWGIASSFCFYHPNIYLTSRTSPSDTRVSQLL